jgi:uncharacterized protein YciI
MLRKIRGNFMARTACPRLNIGHLRRIAGVHAAVRRNVARAARVDIALRNGRPCRSKKDFEPSYGTLAMNENERVAALMNKMLRKKFYVLLSTPVVAPEKIMPHLAAHLDYMIGLEKRGVVFASGPLANADGPITGQGLTVLRAKDADEARAIAEADPFFINGLRSFELKEWTVMEGMLGLRINFSDQSIEVA